MSTTQLMTLLVACSLFSGCNTIQRPDTDLCIINAIEHHQKCYNLRRDYDDNGNLKPGAKPHFKPALTLDDVHKNITTDPDGWANLKAYIRQLRQAQGRKGD